VTCAHAVVLYTGLCHTQRLQQAEALEGWGGPLSALVGARLGPQEVEAFTAFGSLQGRPGGCSCYGPVADIASPWGHSQIDWLSTGVATCCGRCRCHGVSVGKVQSRV
jgi:hypothetical protein